MEHEHSDLQSVIARLEVVERQNSRFKALTGALVSVFGAALLMGQASSSSKIFDAERFIVRGDDGKERASLALSNGVPMFVLRDASNKVRAALGLDSAGVPSLALQDQNGQQRVLLALGSDGTPGVVLRDQAGRQRAGLTVAADGSPGLGIFDASGNQRASLAVSADGSTTLTFDDAKGKRRTAVGMAPDGSPAIYLKDQGGTVIFQAPQSSHISD